MDVIKSQQGSQQGDPLGGVLFGLAFRNFLDEAKEIHHEEALIISLWDDVIVVGPLYILATVANFAKDELRSLALELRPEKSKVWFNGDYVIDDLDHRNAFPERTHFVERDEGIVWGC